MKYFEDGDLTVGIQAAPKPPPFESIASDWHIVWGHIDGNERTTDYDEASSLNLMGMVIRQVEITDKRRKPSPTDDNIQVEFNFLKWGLTYQGRYCDEGPVTNLRLVRNTTPDLVDADDNAVLIPALVTDDQQNNFMSFATSAIDRRQRPLRAAYQNMEFVIKKTDASGRLALELTRNERLRLGYKWDDDGVFEVFNNNDKDVERILSQPHQPGEHHYAVSEKVTKLMKELHRVTENRNHIRTQIGRLKERLVEDLQEAGLTPPSSPLQIPKSSSRKRRTNGNRVSSGGAGSSTAVKRTSSGTTKPTSSSAPRSTPRRATARPESDRKRRKTQKSSRAAHPSVITPNGKISTNNGDDEDDEGDTKIPQRSEISSTASRSAPPPAYDSDDIAAQDDNESVFSTTGGATAENSSDHGNGVVNGSTDASLSQKMRTCHVCKTDVTRRNWGIHINTNKHKTNVLNDFATSGRSSRLPDSEHASVTEDEEGWAHPPFPRGTRQSTGSRPSKRKAPASKTASPEGKLKRPSSIALKRDALVGGARDITTPKSA